MKLELVIVTTVISLITERQVEAELDCYENRDFTGTTAKINQSMQFTKSLFPNGPRACKVPGGIIVIFYSYAGYMGYTDTFYSESERVYRPRERFTVKSIKIVGKPPSDEGVFLFIYPNFIGGMYKFFSGEVENVTGDTWFGSAIVIGKSKAWTVARKCHKTNCQRKCLICLEPDMSGVSFIKSINTTGLDEILAVFPGACLGTNYTGVSKDCLCNQHGVDDGPDKCDGNKGICKCKGGKNFYTGVDCDSCPAPHVYVDGECLECNCNDRGLKDKNNARCDRFGNCRCDKCYAGRLCDRYANGKYVEKYKCKDCGCVLKHVADINNQCRPDGTCICKPGRGGRTCSGCGPNHFKTSSGTCTKCNCTSQFHGTKKTNGVDRKCDENTGQCYCKIGHEGADCKKCKSRYKAKYRNGKLYYCDPCGYCYGPGTEKCNRSNNYRCKCHWHHKGWNCGQCSGGARRNGWGCRCPSGQRYVANVCQVYFPRVYGK